MDIFTFIKDLKTLPVDIDWNKIEWLNSLVEKWLIENKTVSEVEIEENNIYNFQREQTGIMVTIKFQINENNFQLKASYDFYKENCKIDYFLQNKKGEMKKMQLPEDIYEEDFSW